MNTKLRTRIARIARIASSAAAAALITFTGVNLIANYALPGEAASASTQLASTPAAPVR